MFGPAGRPASMTRARSSPRGVARGARVGARPRSSRTRGGQDSWRGRTTSRSRSGEPRGRGRGDAARDEGIARDQGPRRGAELDATRGGGAAQKTRSAVHQAGRAAVTQERRRGPVRRTHLSERQVREAQLGLAEVKLAGPHVPKSFNNPGRQAPHGSSCARRLRRRRRGGGGGGGNAHRQRRRPRRRRHSSAPVGAAGGAEAAGPAERAARWVGGSSHAANDARPSATTRRRARSVLPTDP